ncbi:MAG TPA: pyridoxamine 5'-phosphate oxidase family protein [Candidatus Dorea intestinavium]|nr:pyridoxamine 5'-phosphate oxidase family protein [Candidatus Dorea intestinavium]
MINDKLLEVILSPPDSALTIATKGPGGIHLINSWNSYIQITDDDKLLLPAGQMEQTEKNLKKNNEIKMTICNRDVQGKTYKGTGFLVTAKATFATSGREYEMVKNKFPWARAALVLVIKEAIQTL